MSDMSEQPKPEPIIVHGQPVRQELMFSLEPVGKDWDGSYVPIRVLSYQPERE